MKYIQLKKYMVMLIGILTSFITVIVGIWLICIVVGMPTKKIDNNNISNAVEVNTTPSEETDVVSDNLPKSDNAITGDINVNNINAMVYSLKYHLLVNGDYSPEKINGFINNNIHRFFPSNVVRVDQRATDLDGDGIKEIALMYIKSQNSNQYLMYSCLRWQYDKFVKDIDEELRVNDFTHDNNQILASSIIPNTTQFCFIQRDDSGNLGSTINIVQLLPTGFDVMATKIAFSEIQVRDIDQDGQAEIQMSYFNEDGSVQYSWEKWLDGRFIKVKGDGFY